MQQAVWTAVAFVEGLIGIRFALRLIGANPTVLRDLFGAARELASADRGVAI